MDTRQPAELKQESDPKKVVKREDSDGALSMTEYPVFPSTQKHLEQYKIDVERRKQEARWRRVRERAQMLRARRLRRRMEGANHEHILSYLRNSMNRHRWRGSGMTRYGAYTLIWNDDTIYVRYRSQVTIMEFEMQSEQEPSGSVIASETLGRADHDSVLTDEVKSET